MHLQATKMLLAAWLLLPALVLAQPQAGPDSSVEKSVQAAIDQYDGQMLKQSLLYNGMEDPGYSPAITGIPYLDTDAWQKGDIFYFGRWYRAVPLRYDLVSGQLDIRHFNQVFSLSLVKARVDSFRINQRTFLHLRDSTAGVPDDYYEWLYHGNLQLMASRQKIIMEETSIDGLRRWFSESKLRMFIQREDGSWHDVSNRASLNRFLGKSFRSTRKILRRKKIKYRKAPITYTIEAVRLFDAK